MDELIRRIEEKRLAPNENIPDLYDFTGQEIYSGEEYYIVDNTAVLPDNFEQWLSDYYGIKQSVISRIMEDSGADCTTWANNLGMQRMGENQ